MNFGALKKCYKSRKSEIKKKWQKRKQPKTDQEMFVLLASCILSSQAKWPSVVKVIDKLKRSQALFEGSSEDIKGQLTGLSGRYINKDRLAQYIFKAREMFPLHCWVIRGILNRQINITTSGLSFQDVVKQLQQPVSLWQSLCKQGFSPSGLRQMVTVVKGIDYKQASHFLASIGFEDYAILDTHVLRELHNYAVIKEKPKNLTHKRYLEIEKAMREFSKRVGIPFHHLDTLFWEKGSGVNGDICLK